MAAPPGTCRFDLPHGITLSCLQQGEGPGRVLLLHGFPEAAFAWEPVMSRLAGRARMIAPDLRGYGDSSAPTGVDAYRARHLVHDLCALIACCGGVDIVVGHDWGGALAWSLAASHPTLLRRLVIVNAPHPGTFLRDLQHDPAQQAASAYMNWLCRPDAAVRLAEHGHARLFALFERMGAADASMPHGGWLDAATRARCLAMWQRGLEPALHYYRASPLRPPAPGDDAVLRLQLPASLLHVAVPTRVLWGERDTALLPGLLRGLEGWVPQLDVQRLPDATHWVVHEQPDTVAAAVDASLRELGL